MSIDQPARTAVARTGVRVRSETRASDSGARRSRAIANSSRGPTSRLPFKEPKTDIISAAEPKMAPAGPSSRKANSVETAVALTWRISSRGMTR